jgi:hypothetical protein
MRKRVFFIFTANKGSVFYARNVVFSRSVVVAVRKKFLVELNDFARSASFFSQSVSLCVAAVNPNHFVGLSKRLAIRNELEHFLVVGHNVYLLYE